MKWIHVHLFFIIVLVSISCIACIKLFTSDFFTSHDGEGHVIRMIEFDEAFHDGQMPVRIAKRINYGLGYPFFSFNYPLPYIVGQGFHEIGLTFVQSFKAVLLTGVLIGGVGMYCFLLSHVSPLPAFIGAVFYVIAPYRFLNMYVRGNIAESFALGLLPWLFVGADWFMLSNGKRFGLFTAIGIVFMLSHNGTALIGLPLVFLYILIQKLFGPTHIEYKKIVFVLLFIALSTAFFWVPIAVETRTTKLAELSEDYPSFFPSIKDLIYSPWGFGQFNQGISPGKMSPQIGVVHELLFLVFSGLVVFKTFRRKSKKEPVWFYWFIVIVGIASVSIQVPYAKPLWDNIPILPLIQIPWRFLGLTIFAFSAGAGLVVDALGKNKLVMACMATLLISILFYTNRNHIRINQDISFHNPFVNALTYGFSTTSKDEHMPRLAPRIHEEPDQNGTMIPKDSGVSKRTIWKSNYHEFLVNAANDISFRANVSYFPGWEARIDGIQTPIMYQSDEFQRLRIRVPKGDHVVSFSFHETWYRKVANMVSMFAIGVLVGVLWWKRGVWV